MILIINDVIHLHLSETNENEIKRECEKYRGCDVVITEDTGEVLDRCKVEDVF